MLKEIVVAGLLCLLSLLAGVTALLLAEFGAPVWVFLILLGWLLTLGLPTLAAVLLVASVWDGPSFQIYVVCAAVSGVSWGIHSWRRTPTG